MEKVISTIISFPSSDHLTSSDYNKEQRQLLDVLSRASTSSLVGTRDNDPLDALDFEKHSLGVLYIFNARLSVDRNEITNIWTRVVTFLEQFDGRQLRGSADVFRKLVETFLALCDSAAKPLLAVKPLKSAISRLSPPKAPTTLTYLHVHFIRKCLDSKCFREAISVLDKDIEAFPNLNDKDITCLDHLLYHFYGAIIYIAAKKWKRAAELLTFVITCPGNATSGIQIEAMKKLVFVNLMIDGKLHSLSRITPNHAVRAYRGLTKPYETFANAYQSGSPELLRQETSLVAEIFRQDGNWGLASICLDNYRSLGISALTHTYSTLSIRHIIERDLNVEALSLDSKSDTWQMENFVLGMIERKEIRASLSHVSQVGENATCMVSFHDLPPPESFTLRNLEKQISRTVQITNQSRLLDRKIGGSKEWASWLNRKNRGLDTGAASFYREQGLSETTDAIESAGIPYSSIYGTGVGGLGGDNMDAFDQNEDDFMREGMDDN